MENNKELISNNIHDEDHSYKGALFSSIVFVGGSIVAFTILLIVIYMVRI